MLFESSATKNTIVKGVNTLSEMIDALKDSAQNYDAGSCRKSCGQCDR